MNSLTPHQPDRPLLWPDVLVELKEAKFADWPDDIYVVGGAVRDALLHRPLKDIDLATSGSGMRLARAIANHFNGDFFALDPERDVGRALIDTPDGLLMFDVARFRGADLLADLTDRDFTLNAMAVDLRGDLSLLIDPLGGEQDVKEKRLRRCTPHALPDDPIRALRAVRQSIQFNLRIEAETLADVRQVSRLLSEASPERIRDEFFKLLTLPKIASALRVADSVGLLKVIVPEVEPLHGLKQSPPHISDGWEHTLSVVENLANILSILDYQRSDNLATSFSMGVMAVQIDRYRRQLRQHVDVIWPNERSHRALLMLAALLHDLGKPATASQDEDGRWRFLGHEGVGAEIAEERANSLRLSNAERQRLVTIVANHNRPLWLDDPTPRAVHRFWHQTGEAGVDICLLSLADYLGTVGAYIEQDAWLAFVERIHLLLEAYYDRYDSLVLPPALVDGNQLMRTLRLKPGPIIGELLDLIREAQVTGEVSSPEEAFQLAQTHLKGKS
jgi:poly(A) polymerase